jgi:rhodanese-related sulfurtransferase
MSLTITAAELAELHRSRKEISLIDVRTPAEFREMHVAFAKNVPLDRLDAAAFANGQGDGDRPVYVVCLKGGRGQQASERLLAAGCKNVVNVAGGTIACEAAGLPMTRGQAAMSLERQVRIAAGSLVLVGSALAWFVHPYWLVVPAFVGAGLVFAGVTDTCGMGLLLARMPWNRIGESAPACLATES